MSKRQELGEDVRSDTLAWGERLAEKGDLANLRPSNSIEAPVMGLRRLPALMLLR
jgi:hypothetical protein